MFDVFGVSLVSLV